MEIFRITFEFLLAGFDSDNNGVRAGEPVVEVKGYEDVIERWLAVNAIPATLPVSRQSGYVKFTGSAVMELINMGAIPEVGIDE